jgi:putative heme-binding domain-containing protein
MVWAAFLFFFQAGGPDAQIQRGEKLFADAQKGCASCHALKGVGNAVGPDLTGIARLSPQAITMAVHSTATQYVQAVKLKSGQTVTAMPGPKDDKSAVLFDLSKTPPAAMKVEKGDIVSSNNTDAWKHPPAATKLTSPELADIIAYIKFKVTGAKTAVSPDDVK